MKSMPRAGSRAALIVRAAFLTLVGASASLSGCGPAPPATPAPSDTPAAIATLPPTPIQPAAFDAGAPGDPAIGPDDAFLTILVYCDFQAPECAEVAAHLDALRAQHQDAGGVRIVWRHFPQTDIHDKAGLALQASEAAAAQGAF